jgi:excisionase family DNA binding protein
MPSAATTTRRAQRAPVLPAPRRRYCDVQSAAEYLGVTDRAVRLWMSQGRLTAYRVGRLLRLDWAEVEAFAVRVDPSSVSR